MHTTLLTSMKNLGHFFFYLSCLRLQSHILDKEAQQSSFDSTSTNNAPIVRRPSRSRCKSRIAATHAATRSHFRHPHLRFSTSCQKPSDPIAIAAKV